MSHLEIIDQESVRIAMEYYLIVTTPCVKTTYPVNPQSKWYFCYVPDSWLSTNMSPVTHNMIMNPVRNPRKHIHCATGKLRSIIVKINFFLNVFLSPSYLKIGTPHQIQLIKFHSQSNARLRRTSSLSAMARPRTWLPHAEAAPSSGRSVRTSPPGGSTAGQRNRQVKLLVRIINKICKS